MSKDIKKEAMNKHQEVILKWMEYLDSDSRRITPREMGGKVLLKLEDTLDKVITAEKERIWNEVAKLSGCYNEVGVLNIPKHKVMNIINKDIQVGKDGNNIHSLKQL